MISCGYNGWGDLPEEEREAEDIFEATRTFSTDRPAIRALLPGTVPQRKAA